MSKPCSTAHSRACRGLALVYPYEKHRRKKTYINCALCNNLGLLSWSLQGINSANKNFYKRANPLDLICHVRAMLGCRIMKCRLITQIFREVSTGEIFTRVELACYNLVHEIDTVINQSNGHILPETFIIIRMPTEVRKRKTLDTPRKIVHGFQPLMFINFLAWRILGGSISVGIPRNLGAFDVFKAVMLHIDGTKIVILSITVQAFYKFLYSFVGICSRVEWFLMDSFISDGAMILGLGEGSHIFLI